MPELILPESVDGSLVNPASLGSQWETVRDGLDTPDDSEEFGTFVPATLTGPIMISGSRFTMLEVRLSSTDADQFTAAMAGSTLKFQVAACDREPSAGDAKWSWLTPVGASTPEVDAGQSTLAETAVTPNLDDGLELAQVSTSSLARFDMLGHYGVRVCVTREIDHEVGDFGPAGALFLEARMY